MTTILILALSFVQDEYSLNQRFVEEFREQRWTDAESTATSIINSYDPAYAYYWRAWVRRNLAASSGYRAWYLEHAEADMDTAIWRDGKADYYAMRIYVRTDRENWQGALADADAVWEGGLKEQSYVSVLYEGGRAAFMLRRYSDAEPRFTSVIERDWNFTLAFHARSQARYHQGRYAAAIADCDVVIERGESLADAYYNRALCNEMLKNWSRAAEDYRTAEGHGYNSYFSSYRRGEVLRQDHRYREALESCERAFAVAGDARERSDAHALRGHIRIDRGDAPEEALEEVEKALKEADMWYARDIKAECLIRMGEAEEAIPELVRARDLNPENLNLYVRLAWAYSIAGEADRQIETLEAAYRKDAQNAAVLTALGTALAGRKPRREEALALLDQAIELDARNADAWLQRGLVLSSLGRSEEAKVAFREALRIAPQEWTSRLILVRLLDQG